MLRRALIVLILVASNAGCSESGASSPTAPSTISSPVTLDWGSTLGFRGYTSRSFETTQVGTVTVTLTSAAVPPSWEIGIGLGVPQANGSGCALSASVRAPAGSNPQVSIAVDEGSYCVAVYDVGALTEAAGFTLHLVYP